MRLVVTGLVRRFDTGFAVGPLDLAVDRGLVHLQGPNGSGKTTLLRCLAGELRLTAGQVAVCGRDPHTDADARRHVALVAATPEVPDFLTVEEAWRTTAGLRSAPDWDGTIWRQRLDLPADLRLAHASAGQRRRAELLVGMVGDPDVMLLDEPLANQDQAMRALVAELLADWRTQRAVVVTSHVALPMVPDAVIRL